VRLAAIRGGLSAPAAEPRWPIVDQGVQMRLRRAVAAAWTVPFIERRAGSHPVCVTVLRTVVVVAYIEQSPRG
jgi:hypothetical protein